MAFCTDSFIFAIILLIFSFIIVNSTSDICEQDKNDKCRCIYDSGRGIDLNTLNKNYSLTANLNNLTYYFHACKDIQFPVAVNKTNECTSDDGYSVCMYNKTSDEYVKLGISKEAEFTPSDKHEINYLRYDHKEYSTSILLVCVPDIAGTHLVVNQPSNKSHSLLLYSSEVCVHEIIVPGLSGFAVFIIVLISVFLAYLVVGILVNKLVLGARGIEMLPNLAFWRSLPSKLMMGVEFIRNGCRRRSDTTQLDPNSYDAI